MSIEYVLTLSPKWNQDYGEFLRRTLKGGLPYEISRTEEAEWGLASAGNKEERITVKGSADEIYLAFHIASRSERNLFLQTVAEALHTQGIDCQVMEW